MSDFHLFQIGKSISIVIILILLRYVLKRVVVRFARKSELVEHRTGLIIKHIDFAIIFLIILGMIFIWGVETKDLGWALSSVFAVIGVGFFAQWSILSNITSGVIMFFTFPYKIGDYIKIHDKEYEYEGTIDDIKAFQVILKTTKGEIITYPNSMMLQKGVTVIKPEELDEYLEQQEVEGENKHHEVQPED
ncbi:mechanosensitive ion channel family protein [Flavobacteriaceae bacterium TK19130]|nr:mechanosensitive ion channel family protein [Thermobacterium salinum]